jgi:predicted DCC family thiol-disulfide oxidoreductase YuxK
VLFYDAGCGVCAWIALRAMRAARPGTLRVASIDSPEADAHLGHLSDTDRWASWHLLSEDGRLRSGGAALPALLERLPRTRRLAALPRAMPRLTDGLYRAMARTRTRWGRLVPRRSVARARQELRLHPTNPQAKGRVQCTIR